MRILTFDIEEWYIEKSLRGGRAEKYNEYDTYLANILDLLDRTSTKATFFCLGKIATDFPYVVKEIASRGHEIGCHSKEHLWLTQMTPDELRKDTADAIKALEDVSSQHVVSYRAPAFSIGKNNDWAFDVLSECGIERDASVFPAIRDFGGFPDFGEAKPTVIKTAGGDIFEYPVNLVNILGRQFAYSGGGYFRFFPYWFIESELKKSKYFMAYFHIGDLIHNTTPMMTKEQYERYFREPGTLPNRLKRYFKSHVGTSGAYPKMQRLIMTFDFINLNMAAETDIFEIK